MTRRCPHPDIRFCPLYHAAHEPRFAGNSCDDGELGDGLCGVDRKRDYRACLAAITARDPRMVAELEFAEAAEAAAEQRRRNMRAARLH